MLLCIMTRGRVDKQETLKHIPKKWQDRTWLVCPPEEARDHKWPRIAARKTLHYSDKFQQLYDGRIFSDENKVVIMDDDLYFNRYEGDRLVTIKDPEENESLFDFMEKALDQIPLVGVHPRMMAQNVKGKTHDWNGKIVTIQGLNRTLLPRDLRLDRFPILADVFLNCEVLSRGLPNARICTHFVDWLPSQSSGGCDYRTADMQRRATGAIAEEFAPYARQVIKRPKTAKWLGEERYDLHVRWKDLYNDAPRASRLLDQGEV